MEWLFKEDDYIPENQSEEFIDKTNRSILKMLSKIRRQDSRNEKGFIYRINPGVKLAGFLTVIAFLSISKVVFYPLTVDIFILFGSVFFVKDRGRAILFGFGASFFAFIMLLPSMIFGNILNSVAIALKIFGDVVLLNILSSSTKWTDIIKALKLIRIPDLFIFVIDTAVIYIFILGELAWDMFQALKIRSIGKMNRKYASVSGIIGNIFIKSKGMAEELYSAMECRGFTGEYRMKLNSKLTIDDFIFILIISVIIISYFLI